MLLIYVYAREGMEVMRVYKASHVTEFDEMGEQVTVFF